MDAVPATGRVTRASRHPAAPPPAGTSHRWRAHGSTQPSKLVA